MHLVAVEVATTDMANHHQMYMLAMYSGSILGGSVLGGGGEGREGNGILGDGRHLHINHGHPWLPTSYGPHQWPHVCLELQVAALAAACAA